MNDQLGQVIRNVSERILPKQIAQRQRPWISQNTLQLIDERQRAREQRNSVQEQNLTREIKARVKIDRNEWLR